MIVFWEEIDQFLFVKNHFNSIENMLNWYTDFGNLSIFF